MTTIEVHESLINEFHDYWEANPGDRVAVLSEVSERHQAAVRLGKLNYQVENGGFSQWEDNGYGIDAEALLDICERGISLGLENFKELKGILKKFMNMPAYKSETEEESCDNCNGVGHHGDEDDESYEENMCENCYGTGEVANEYNNDYERNSIFEEVTDAYFALDGLLSEMNTLLLRWDEIDKAEAEKLRDQNQLHAPPNEKTGTKPLCDLTGIDGNVFNIIGHVSKTLKRARQYDKAKEFSEKAIEQESYDAVLRLLMDYVEVKI